MDDLLKRLSGIAAHNLELRQKVLQSENYSFKNAAYMFTLQNWVNGWNEYLNNRDVVKTKHYFNENGFIDINRVEILNERLLDMQNTRDNFCCVALSDNQELINAYSNINYEIKYISRDKEIKIPFVEFARKGELVALFSHCIQQVLKKNLNELSKLLVIFKTLLERKKMAAVLYPDYEFLESLLSGNIDNIKSKIEVFLTNKLHGQRMKEELILKEYISQPAILFLKLSWMLGYQLELNHKYIPMDLMPVRALDVYEESYKDLLK